jgi:hypothetical protein
MATGNTKTINPWEWDVRVRERNLNKAIFDEKDVEKHLASLPDAADQAEVINIPQPALGGRDGRDD